MNKPKPRQRNADATQKRILEAARQEFAQLGLGGARVDAIAARAKANKRMIYAYFGNKEQLFTAVLDAAYTDIRMAERALELEKLDPVDAIIRLVRFTWDYYLEHPEFLTFVNSENLHKARHLKHSVAIRALSRTFVGMMKALLDRGVTEGVFRRGIDPVQLNITIAAIGYYYLTNRFTGAIVFERDLMTKSALKQRLAFNTDTILRLVLTPKALARIEHAT
ncbi:MAG: TetR/AcrR family transcriptional regulator [Hyphomicrobiales bacterium]